MSVGSLSTAALITMYLLAEEPLLTNPVSVLQPRLVEHDLVEEERVGNALPALVEQKRKFWKFRTANSSGVILM